MISRPASPAPIPRGSEIVPESGGGALSSSSRSIVLGLAPPPEMRPDPRARRNDGLALAGVACLFLGGAASFVDPDVFHCMSLARESIAAGRLLASDVYAYTPTVTPVVHHEWLHGIILHGILAWGGASLFLAWKYVLVLAIGICAFLLSSRRGASAAAFAILAPAAILMAWTGMTTIRAQMYTLLFTAILLHFLEDDRAGRKLWVLPWLVLHVLWLNIHGGFVVGCALVALHAVEQALRRRPVGHVLLGLAGAAALIAANPYGLEYYGYLARAIFLDRSSISEWEPLWRGFPPVLLIWSISLVVPAYAIARKGLRGSPGALLLAATAWASLRHQRHLSIHAVVWISIVPSLIEGTILGEMLRRFQMRRMATALWMALLLGALTLSVLFSKPWILAVPAHPGDSEKILYPSAALEYLKVSGFRGNVIVPFTLGAYVSWKLHPAVRVSIDGRYEVAYDPALLEEHVVFYNAREGWKDFLLRYPSDLALIPRNRIVAPRMRAESGWSVVYEDDAFEIYARPGLELPVSSRRGERLVGTFP